MALLLIQTGGTLWVIVVLFALAWLATYIAMRRSMDRTAANLRAEMDARFSALLISLKAPPTPVVAASLPVAADALPKAVPAPQPAAQPPEVSPEMLVMIAAAVTAFLGKKVRIRSAKMLQTPYEIVNPWVQQGRVVVQASHNLGPRGRS